MTRGAWAVWLVAIAAAAEAMENDLTVIYDNGETRPLAPYFAPFEQSAPRAPVPADEEELGAANLEALLQIRTPELTPGPVTPRPWPLSPQSTPTRPLFLVGADERSLHWLARNRDQLLESHAVGLIVQADSLADLNALAELAAGIPLIPASGSDMARIYGLRHIPVLISRDGIRQ